MKKANNKALASVVGFIPIIVIALLVGFYLNSTLNSTVNTVTNTTQTSSSTGSNSEMEGIVTGYVTVGTSQSVCTSNQSCNENLRGYSVVFTLQCSQKSNCQTSMAAISPSGHYSILLPPGNYSVTGLYPSCDWTGCSSAFPQSVVVEGGMQLVFNINIGT